MAERALVSGDIGAAKRFVQFLDENGFAVKAALWLYESDAERWSFFVSLSEQRQNIGTFYIDVARLLSERGRGRDLLPLDRVAFVDAERSFVGKLAIGMKGRPIEGRRLTDEQINGMFVEDALILRLPA